MRKLVLPGKSQSILLRRFWIQTWTTKMIKIIFIERGHTKDILIGCSQIKLLNRKYFP